MLECLACLTVSFAEPLMLETGGWTTSEVPVGRLSTTQPAGNSQTTASGAFCATVSVPTCSTARCHGVRDGRSACALHPLDLYLAGELVAVRCARARSAKKTKRFQNHFAVRF